DASVAFPTASAGSPAGIELAADLRIAYWRDEPNGDTVLWAADLDGRRRYVLHTAADRFRIGETRWSGDGSAVSYIERDVAIVVLPLGGARDELTLPVALDPRLREVLDHRWSTDGRWIAATLWTLDGATDVYAVQPETGSWRRLTAFGDAFVGEWLDERELIVQTQRGLLAVVDVEAPSAIRPFNGVPATSPLVGSDGRVHFLVGRFVGEDQLSGYPIASRAVAYSASADGGDMRREGAVEHDQVRLLGTWPGGRYLAGHGRPSILGTTENGRLPLPGGPYDRAIALPSGRHALVLARGRLSMLDVAAAERTPRPPSAVTVLLDGVRDFAAWWPRAEVRRGGSPTRDPSVPLFRSAAILGGHLWLLEPSPPRLLGIVGPSEAVARAAWSGDGRLLVLVGPLDSSSSTALLVDPASGAIERRLHEGAIESMDVRPDGLAVVVSDRSGVVRVLDLDGRQLGDELAGRDAAWSQAGLFWIDRGRSSFGSLATFGHSLWAEREGERRVVASGGDLLRQIPHSGEPADLDGRVQLGELVASPDGTHVSLDVFDSPWRRLTRVIVRVGDGAVVELFAGGSSRPSWSPDGGALGITILSQEQPPLAVLMRGDGRRFAEIPGTFAGWTPDGEWFLVAGPEGLFAHPIDLPGRRHFLSPIGVPVVTTAP
ncbi:MAG TPA: hypothetical protein VMJ92_03620, partial [Candidatus Limnocylindrales bacterium]|nr:hypothetical protein [Candidatus Limnocylindrales bacterium]